VCGRQGGRRRRRRRRRRRKHAGVHYKDVGKKQVKNTFKKHAKIFSPVLQFPAFRIWAARLRRNPPGTGPAPVRNLP